MITGIEALTQQALTLALDAASLRQQAIAANIANASTPGYARQRVDFEDQLDAARRSLSTRGTVDAFSLAQVRPRMVAAVTEDGMAAAMPQLDMEVAALTQNAVQYQALLKGLSREFAIYSMAVSDGKR